MSNICSFNIWPLTVTLIFSGHELETDGPTDGPTNRPTRQSESSIAPPFCGGGITHLERREG